MTFDEMCNEVRIILKTLRVEVKEHYPNSKIQFQFIIDKFGTVVHVIDTRFFEFPEPGIDPYEEWFQIYIDRTDDLIKKKEEIIWTLSKAGYMIWLRHENPQAFKNLILNYNYGEKIIKERIKVWDGKPKYRFLIDYNTKTIGVSSGYLMSVEPGFFDYLPE